jgi:hypothetical protein
MFCVTSAAEQPTILNEKSLWFLIDEASQFLGPREQPIAVRRILGIDRSLAISELSGGNRFVLINPHEALFAEFGFVDTGEYLATTLQLDRKNDRKGAVSADMVRVSDHGYIELLTPGVRSEGVIIAAVSRRPADPRDKILLDLMSDGLIRYAIDQSELGQLTGVDEKALAKGSAEGGEPDQLLINAHSVADIQRSAINSSTVPRAHRLVVKNGSVRLEAARPIETVPERAVRSLDVADDKTLGHEGESPRSPSAIAKLPPPLFIREDSALPPPTRFSVQPPLIAKKQGRPSGDPPVKTDRAEQTMPPSPKLKTRKSAPHPSIHQTPAPAIPSQAALPEWMKYLPKSESAADNPNP